MRTLSTQLEIDLIKSILTDINDLVLFDIGAHDFSTGIILKHTFPTATVYGFEPDFENIRLYSSQASSNGVNVEGIALGDIDGIKRFYPSNTYHNSVHRQSGSIHKPRVIPNTSEGLLHKTLMFDMEGHDVNVLTIDTFCKRNGIKKIDFIHMDVQGAEFDVMKGIGEYRPKIIAAETCEFNTYETGITKKDFDNLMLELGYNHKEEMYVDTLYIHNHAL